MKVRARLNSSNIVHTTYTLGHWLTTGCGIKYQIADALNPKDLKTERTTRDPVTCKRCLRHLAQRVK